MDYLEALFDNDIEQINHFKESSAMEGHGPLAICTHVANTSSIRVNCHV